MTSILQKRVRELVQGSKPLVETKKVRPVDIALRGAFRRAALSLEQGEDVQMPQAPADIFGTEA